MIFTGMALLVGVSAFFVARFARKFEETLPLTLGCVFLVLYGFCMAGLLRFAVPALALLAAGSAVYFVVSAVRKKDGSALARLFTPGLAAFLLFGAVLQLLTRSLTGGLWDEISHWMLAVKELWLCDTQGVAFRSLLNFPYYPPFAPLLEYLFMKCACGFSEPMAYAANALLCLSFLLPVFRNVSWKRWYTAVVYAAIVFLLPLVIFPAMLGDVYVDTVMGPMLAFILYAWFSSSEKDAFCLLSVCAGLCMLSMTKTMGVEICLIPMAIIALDWLLARRAAKKSGRVKRKAPNAKRTLGKTALLSAAYGLLAFGSHAWWHLSLRVAGASSDLAGSDAAVAEGGLFASYRITGLLTAFARLTEERPTGCFTLSIAAVAALLLLVGLELVYRARGRADYRSLCVFVGGTAAGLAAYFAETVLAILLIFVPRQAVIMFSLERYLDTYLLAMLCAFVMIRLELSRDKDGFLCAAVVCCALVPFTALSEVTDYTDEREWRASLRAPYAEALEEMDALGLAPGADTVCFVEQSESNYGYYMFHYLAAPVETRFCGSVLLGEPADALDELHRPLTAEEWGNAVLDSGCRYVYVHLSDAYFTDTMGVLFASPIRDGAFYRVSRSEACGLMLTAVESTEERS